MRIVDEGIVYDATRAPAEQRFCSFTNPLVLSDGRILAIFRAGSSKDAEDENLMILESRDEGHTWEPVLDGLNQVVGGVRGAWRVGYLTEAEPGRLIASINWFDRSQPGATLANPETGGVLPALIFAVESLDGGRHWSFLGQLNSAPYTGIALTSPLLKLRAGALALPYESWKAYYDERPGQHRALLALSLDGGHSFGPAIVVAHDPADRVFYWDERLSVDPTSGEIITTFWTHDRVAGEDINMHIAWGTPDGQTWTAPRDTGLAGQHPFPLALGHDRVLMVYEHRQDPAGMHAILSHDGGRTWDPESQIAFYASAGSESGAGAPREFMDYWGDMLRWTFGHPAPARLPDGDVFVVFYAGDAQAMSVRWVRLGL